MATAERNVGGPTAWWRRYLVAGLTAAAVFALLPRGSVLQGLLYPSAQLGAFAAMVAGIRLGRPARRLPWVLILAGTALLFAGGVFSFAGRSDPSLIADVGYAAYLAWYATLLSAIVLLLRARGADRGTAIDALNVATGLGVLAWIFLAEPFMRLSTVTSPERIMLTFSAVEDFAVIAASAWLLLTPGRRPPALRLLLLFVAAQLVADSAYSLTLLHGVYSPSAPIDALGLVSLAILGAAFLHPSMPEVSEPSAPERQGPEAWRVPSMVVTALIPAATLIVESLLGRRPHALLVGLVSVVTIPLAFARIRGLMVSIDEHRRVEAQLEQTQAWYRGLVEELPAFTYIDVPDGRPSDGYRTIYASPQIEDMLGYPSEGFIEDAELWGRILHPDDRERQFAEDAHLWETGEPYVSEYRLFARDGRVVWVRNHAALMRGGSDPFTVAQGVLYDITESKHAEEALRTSESRFRSLLEHGPEGVLTVDTGGTITLVNHQSERLFGYAPGELIGRRLEDLVPEAARGAHEAHRRRYQADPAIRPMGRELEVSGRRRDGTIFPADISLSSLSDEDRGSIVVAFIRDLTERKRSERALAEAEQKYRTLVERIPAIVYSAEFGEPGPWLYVSPQAEWILGYPAQEWIADEGLWMRLIHPDDLERTLEEERRSNADGTPFVCEYRMRARDGHVVWIRDEAEVVYDGSGAPAELRGIMYDVTERRRTEDALADAERRYRGVFENAAEAIFVTSLEGRYVLANPALAEMLGYSSPQELTDQVADVAGLYPAPSWREEFLRRLDREDTLRDFEYQVTRQDGSMIWVSENVRAVRDANGRMIGCEGMSTDITARKHAELALTASEERFRQLSEAAFEGVIVDVGGHIVQANRAFCEMFDLSPDEVIGSSPADAMAPESLPRVLEHLRSGRQTPEDIEVVRKDGSRLTLETTIRRVERDGEEAHLVTMRDVTERRAIEDLLRRRDAVLGAVAFAAARFLAGPWEADIDGVLARLGEAADTSRVCLFRNEPGEGDAPLMTLAYEWTAPGISTTIGDPANERFPYEHDYVSWVDELGAGRVIHGNRNDFPDAVMKDLEAEDVVSIAAVPVFSGDAWWGYLTFDDCVGERVWPETDLELLQTAAGVLGGAIARTNAERELGLINAELEERVTDRTAEMVVAMEEAKRARESAEGASRAKSEFLSRASHELRTPLNAILGFSQLLEGSALPDEDAESVHEIITAGRHLLGLVNEVLDIARLDAGRLALSLEPVSVEGAVHEALELVLPQALGRGIQLRTEIPPDDPHVMADQQRLQQVLLNLLSNAVKFDREEGTVTVSCDGSEERVVLRVTDTGPGIAPERLEGLFTPFDRLGAGTVGSAGAGLGLALSRSLVEAMGGRITVESMLDAGSTFSVELPRAQAPAPDGDLPVAEPGTPAAPRTVLYIEDNLANLRLVERIVMHQPAIRLLSAMQGDLGLELAREHHPDLILLDLHLPDIAGEDVLRMLKEEPETADIPIVVMSAKQSGGQAERLIDAGALGYLPKPFDVHRLLEILERVLAEPASTPTASA